MKEMSSKELADFLDGRGGMVYNIEQSIIDCYGTGQADQAFYITDAKGAYLLVILNKGENSGQKDYFTVFDITEEVASINQE